MPADCNKMQNGRRELWVEREKGVKINECRENPTGRQHPLKESYGLIRQ